MFQGRRRYVVLGIVAGTLALLMGVGVAYARGPQPPFGDWQTMRRGPFPGGGRFADPLPFQGLASVTADLTGLSEEEVMAALEDGHTFVEIAKAEGADPQELLESALAEHAVRLDDAVQAGRLTEAQREEMLEQLEQRIADQLNRSCEPRIVGTKRFGGRLLGRFGDGWTGLFDAVADALGMEPVELFKELHGGKSVEELAEAGEVDLEAVRDALEAAQSEARRQAIEEGRLSEDRAEWMKEGLDRGFMPGAKGFGRGGRPRPQQGPRGRGMGR